MTQPSSGLSQLSPAYSSIIAFVVSHGLISTWVVVRIAERDVSDVWLGGLTASHFLGLALGAFVNLRLLSSVGHVRTYAAHAALLIIVALGYSISGDPLWWLLLRLLGGFATGGLILVVESWLLLNSQPRARGRVMAIYLLLFYGFMAAGQFVIGQIDTHRSEGVAMLAAAAIALSILPMALTRSPVSLQYSAQPMRIIDLARRSPSGFVGCLSAGMMLGVVYGFLPAYLFSGDFDRETAAMIVAVVTIGGMALQYPFGRLSDRMDRRWLLMVLGSLNAILCIGLEISLTIAPLWAIAALFFMSGGLIYSLYPISLSQACDELQQHEIVGANQSLLIVYSLGSIVGPIVFAMAVFWLSARFFLIYLLAISVLLLVFMLWRQRVRLPVPLDEHLPYSAAISNTPLSAEIDPRS